MELTLEELAQVRAAYESAAQEQKTAEDYGPISSVYAKQSAVAAQKLLSVWNKMTEDERASVRTELAALSGGDAHELDVGLAAYRVVKAAKGSPGNHVRDGGFNAAVLEAVHLWESRGNTVKGVNHWRDADDKRDPRPLLAFVASAIQRALPAEAISQATRMKNPDQNKLLQSIEARLRK